MSGVRQKLLVAVSFVQNRWLRRLHTRAAVERFQARHVKKHGAFLRQHSPYFRDRVVSSGRGNTSLTYHCRPSLTAAPYAQPEYQTPTFYADDYLTARPQTPNPQLYAHPNQCL